MIPREKRTSERRSRKGVGLGRARGEGQSRECGAS